jgi:hypothetical protein
MILQYYAFTRQLREADGHFGAHRMESWVHSVAWSVEHFFTIQQTQPHSVQGNLGYNAITSCNCTSDIVILNVGTTYHKTNIYMKCTSGVRGVWLACISLWFSTFKIHWVILIYSISQQRQPKQQLWSREPALWRHVYHVIVQPLSSDVMYIMLLYSHWALTSCIACYCTATELWCHV